ncbi:MAG TPA: hydroxymethylglutaryl-CoA lyase [Candidatus Elarobacter sp.]
MTLIDVTTRDGLQDEPKFVATARKAEVVAALAASGIAEIEATSFVHPRWVPQLADAEALIPALPRGPRYSTLILNERGYERARAAFDAAGYARGSYDLVFVASASPRHNASNNNRTIPETLAYFETIAKRAREDAIALRGAVSCSFASPWADEEIDPNVVVEIATGFAAGDCTMVTLADTIGKAAPETVSATIASVQESTGVALSLHFHDLRGSALRNVEAGLERGVRIYEGVLGGIGGCPFAPEAPGNLDLESLARFVEAKGFTTGVNTEKLAAARGVLLAALAEAVPI